MKFSPNPKPERTRFATLISLLLSSLVLGPTSFAGLPEPDTIFYGAIALDGAFATAANIDVTVELRQTEDGPAVATYRMGDSAAVGDRYLLRARVESAAPVNDPSATPLGGTVFLVVKKNDVVRDSQAHLLTARGTFVNLNFGDADSDGDGMSDGFEQRYFGSATGADPNADPDHDGRPNRREFLQGTDPTVADGQHPADVTPADDRLNIQEITEYALAWKLGDPWTIEPLTIPVDYVTRASALWVGGERYVFDNDPPTTAPLWWVSDPSALPPAASLPEITGGPTPALATRPRTGPEAASVHARLLADARAANPARAHGLARQGLTVAEATRILPLNYVLNQPFTVTITVTPASETRAFAVEEAAPTGWLVRYITADGRYDARNKLIKWGPFYGPETRTLTYEVTPLNAEAAAEFVGAGSFDGTSRVIIGRAVVYPPGGSPVAHLSVIWDLAGPHLQLLGAPGQAYIIEASAELQDWTALDPMTTDDDGLARLAVSPGTDRRFFRLRPQP